MEAADREALILRYMPLVRTLALKYRHFGQYAGYDLDDLIGVGSAALVQAADRFDPERGVRFGYYAQLRVRDEIRHSIRDHNGPVRVSRSAWENGERAVFVPLLECDKTVDGPGVDSIILEQALEILPDEQRAMIYLHYQEGVTLRELADLAGRSSQGVANMMCRALARLRRRLSPMFAG